MLPAALRRYEDRYGSGAWRCTVSPHVPCGEKTLRKVWSNNMNFWYILLALLVFGIMIFVHELGHYTMARIFHVTIREFALGMGPKILTRTSKKTGIAYSLRLFPIGGFVSMVGEDEASDDEGALNKKPVWQRMLITVAGAVMNLLLGFLIMCVLVCTSRYLSGTTVAQFTEGAVSSQTGLEVGDEILKIGGRNVHIADDLGYAIMHDAVEPVDVTVKRNGQTVVLPDVQFPTVIESGHAFGSPDFQVYGEEKNIGSVLYHSFYKSANTVTMIWESLIDLVTGRYGVEDLSGPVGVTGAISTAAKSGMPSLANMFVFISINLGIFNLLPLPARDGGRLVFQLIELIARRPVNPVIEGYIHFAGIVLLMLLMVVVTFKDILRLFPG